MINSSVELSRLKSHRLSKPDNLRSHGVYRRSLGGASAPLDCTMPNRTAKIAQDTALRFVAGYCSRAKGGL